jgi:hypothetical protein
MADPLAIYLHDHLAGATGAVDLLEAMQKRYHGEPLGEFAATMLVEIKDDRRALEELADRVGEGVDLLKETAAWISEKATRLKLRRGAPGGLDSFEALEFLGLGIQGKLALWTALNSIAPSDERLRGTDFALLIERARAQHARVEEQRLALAQTALIAS